MRALDKGDGKGDVWASSKVSPMGMVKLVDNNEDYGLNQSDYRREEPHYRNSGKFDPQMMRQATGKRP